MPDSVDFNSYSSFRRTVKRVKFTDLRYYILIMFILSTSLILCVLCFYYFRVCQLHNSNVYITVSTGHC